MVLCYMEHGHGVVHHRWLWLEMQVFGGTSDGVGVGVGVRVSVDVGWRE